MAMAMAMAMALQSTRGVQRSKQAVKIGIIGLGQMGQLYARKFSESGWRVVACDKPENYEKCRIEFQDSPIAILENGHLVSRESDFTIYSVEAEYISQVVKEYGPSTKKNGIVGGQTSCKAPEIEAFEKFLPDDVKIVSCHSMHGPTVDPHDQPLVIIPHRSDKEDVEFVEQILSCLGSRIIHLSAEEHDKVTADTQAVPHAAFLTMGTAWHANDQFPWELSQHSGGVENIKINVTLRIYSSKWHVYAGVAILNPAARTQILEYSKSVVQLFSLIVEKKFDEFRNRIVTAGKAVFAGTRGQKLLLDDEVLEKFSLGSIPKSERKSNNQLSLLSMVDCWYRLGVNPYDRMICSTPVYRMWLGAVEYIFCKSDFLEEALKSAIEDPSFRRDDLEFCIAARSWAECVKYRNFEMYKQKFENTQKYFEPRFDDAVKLGNEMIRTIMSNVLV